MTKRQMMKWRTDKMREKTTGLEKKCCEGYLEMFPLVNNIYINETLPIIVDYLTSLEEKFNSYFLSVNN